MATEPTITRQEQEAYLSLAFEAARAADPGGMLTHLYNAQALDGLTRQLRARWKRLGDELIDRLICEAIEELYVTVRAGRTVANPVGYLWKTTENKACDEHARRPRELALPVDGDGLRPVTTVAAPPRATHTREHRQEGLRLARTLLPHLGQENLQQVLAYILDAVEAGRAEVPTSEIASALGLRPNTVSVLRRRAFDRLARVAKEKNLVTNRSELGLTEPEDPDEWSDDQ